MWSGDFMGTFPATRFVFVGGVVLRSAVLMSMGASVLFWDGKVKCRAAVHRAFRPGSAAVAVNDALDVGQADACALEFVLAVQALKHAE